MYFIRKQLDMEVDPMNLPSRDKTRTNKHGINLDLLKQGSMTYDEGFLEKKNNPFTKERRSMDLPIPQNITPRN
jgi:hypothetical protein